MLFASIESERVVGFLADWEDPEPVQEQEDTPELDGPYAHAPRERVLRALVQVEDPCLDGRVLQSLVLAPFAYPVDFPPAIDEPGPDVAPTDLHEYPCRLLREHVVDVIAQWSFEVLPDFLVKVVGHHGDVDRGVLRRAKGVNQLFEVLAQAEDLLRVPIAAQVVDFQYRAGTRGDRV